MWKTLLQKVNIFLPNSKDLLAKLTHLAPVVQTLDRAIHWITHYPLDNSIGFASVYPLDSDLSGGQRYPSFEQLGPDSYTAILVKQLYDIFIVVHT